jgi:cell shape-determining protein MreD
MMRAFRWLLVVLSIVAFQGLLAEYLAPGGVGLRWALLIVLLAGLTGGTTRGALTGGLVGFVTDCLTPAFLGWGMLVMVTVGAAVGMARERLFLERIYSRWLVFAAGIALHDIVYLLPVTGFDMKVYFQTLWLDTGISVLVTSIVGAVTLAAWQATRTTDKSRQPTKVGRTVSG